MEHHPRAVRKTPHHQGLHVSLGCTPPGIFGLQDGRNGNEGQQNLGPRIDVELGDNATKINRIGLVEALEYGMARGTRRHRRLVALGMGAVSHIGAQLGRQACIGIDAERALAFASRAEAQARIQVKRV